MRRSTTKPICHASFGAYIELRGFKLSPPNLRFDDGLKEKVTIIKSQIWLIGELKALWLRKSRTAHS